MKSGVDSIIPLRRTLLHIIIGYTAALTLLPFLAPAESRALIRIYVQASIHHLISKDRVIDVKLNDTTYQVAASAILEHPRFLEVVRPWIWTSLVLGGILSGFGQVAYWIVIKRRIDQWKTVMGSGAGVVSVASGDHMKIWLGGSHDERSPVMREKPEQVVVVVERPALGRTDAGGQPIPMSFRSERVIDVKETHLLTDGRRNDSQEEPR